MAGGPGVRLGEVVGLQDGWNSAARAPRPLPPPPPYMFGQENRFHVLGVGEGALGLAGADVTPNREGGHEGAGGALWCEGEGSRAGAVFGQEGREQGDGKECDESVAKGREGVDGTRGSEEHD